MDLNPGTKLGSRSYDTHKVAKPTPPSDEPPPVLADHQNTEEQEFTDLFPDIVSAVVTSPTFAKVPKIRARVEELLEYNSLGGNMTRGLMTVCAYQMLESPEKITDATMRQARVLGWCVELTSLIILDDMSDRSSTRRGVECWYRRPDVGLLAINDSLMMLSCVFDLLKDNFGGRSYYPELLHVFKEALSNICIGQYPVHTENTSQFSMENFRSYSDHKRTYYTFKLPVYIGLFLAEKPHKDVFNNVEEILSEMGVLISMQNDYMDCFEDEAIAGKVGNDIQEGKCTWLAVTALQRCSATQRAEFEACYGSADAASVQRVKRLYEQLHLPDIYRESERTIYNKIVSCLEALPVDNPLPSALLIKLFKMAYQMKAD